MNAPLSLSWRQTQQLPGYSVTCSRDGNYIVTGTPDSCIRIFSCDNNGVWQERGSIKYPESEGGLNSLACSRDGSVLVAGFYSYVRVLTWDGTTLTQAFEHHDDMVRTVSCSADGTLFTVYAGPKDAKNGYAFKLRNGQWHKSWSLQEQGDILNAVTCSGDGKRIITGFMDNGALRIFQEQDGIWHEQAITHDVGNNTFWSLATSYDGSLIVAGQVVDLTAEVFLYEQDSIKRVALLKLATRLASVSVACSNEGSVIVVGGGSDGNLGIFVRRDHTQWKEFKRFILPSHVDDIACSADASLIVVGVGGTQEEIAVYVYKAE